MKKLAIASLSILFLVGYSCKDAKKEKEENKPAEVVVKDSYVLNAKSTTVSFTAYKTTEKKPVGGQFTEINIKNSVEGASPLEALNGIEFGIPVSSLFTNDATKTRDPKLKEFFFGVMKDTEIITGTFKVTDGKNCSIDVTLNGQTNSIALTAETEDSVHYAFSGTMDLEKWDAVAAVASLNKACEALHTGPDGVSKTWNEVAVAATVVIDKK